MRRWLLIPLVLFTFAALAKEKPISKELLEAKTVKVLILPGNLEHVGTYSPSTEDRNAVNDVKDALRRWGRWKVVGDRESADLTILVRHGKRGEIGGSYPAHAELPNSPYDPGQRVGAAVGPNDNHERGESGMVDRQMAPKYDILAVFTAKEGKSAVHAGGGKIINAKPLWEMNEEGALREKTVPAVEALRDVIERSQTAAKN
jgi:hypothetical protein